jgi:hypothetical protein
MGKSQIVEGFDSKVSSNITGSLAVSTNVTASNSLRVGNDATIGDELYLPGIEDSLKNHVLMYNTSTDAVSYAHRSIYSPLKRTVHRLNIAQVSSPLIINSTSTPTIFDLNGANIITTTDWANSPSNRLRLSLFDYNPSTQGDFSCTIIHKGIATQDGGFSTAEIKLDIFLPQTSIVGNVTYNVAMLGTATATNFNVNRYTTYSAGQLIQFSDSTKWGAGTLGITLAREISNSAIVHVMCSFSTNYIAVHSTNWNRLPESETP